jgi:hypothetical protein
MYKLIFNSMTQNIQCVNYQVDNILYSIPLTDPSNTDYQNFKKEVLAGAELQDADGNVMTTEEVNEFVATLP